MTVLLHEHASRIQEGLAKDCKRGAFIHSTVLWKEQGLQLVTFAFLCKNKLKGFKNRNR